MGDPKKRGAVGAAPAPDSHRATKVAQLLREELMSMLLRGDIHDPAVEGCTISNVTVTRDLSLARVYVRLLDVAPTAAKQARVVAALEHANGFIRRSIASRLKLRRAPELRFAWDDVADRGRRVDELLYEIEQDASATRTRDHRVGPASPGAPTDRTGKARS
jgi:ribosome-binding factor A